MSAKKGILNYIQREGASLRLCADLALIRSVSASTFLLRLAVVISILQSILHGEHKFTASWNRVGNGTYLSLKVFPAGLGSCSTKGATAASICVTIYGYSSQFVRRLDVPFKEFQVKGHRLHVGKSTIFDSAFICES